jgi:hypothetical protein
VTVGCVFRQFPDTVSFRCVGGRTAHDWVRPVVAVLVSAGHESKRSLRHASALGVLTIFVAKPKAFGLSCYIYIRSGARQTR